MRGWNGKIVIYGDVCLEYVQKWPRRIDINDDVEFRMDAECARLIVKLVNLP